MANMAGGPKPERGVWLPSASGVGALGLLYAAKEGVFGRFQMSGNSNGKLLCQNYCLGCTF